MTSVQIYKIRTETADNVWDVFKFQLAQDGGGKIHPGKQNHADHHANQRKFDGDDERAKIALTALTQRVERRIHLSTIPIKRCSNYSRLYWQRERSNAHPFLLGGSRSWRFQPCHDQRRSASTQTRPATLCLLPDSSARRRRGFPSSDPSLAIPFLHGIEELELF